MGKKKKEPEGEQNFERWLLPYADMITLLLAFFIIMYALTLIEKEKAAQILAELSKAFGGAPTESKGVPNLVSGGKRFPNPVIKSTGEFKKGTNKKVSYIENTGKNPTIGNILNLTTQDETLEASYIGVDSELVSKLKGLDQRLFNNQKSFGDTSEGNLKSRDIVIKVGKSKKLPETGEINIINQKFLAKGENLGSGKSIGEKIGDRGGRTIGESGGEKFNEIGGSDSDEEGNFRYKVNDPYLESVALKLSSFLSSEIKTESLEVKVTQRGIEMIISGDILFELGSVELLPQSIKLIEKLTLLLKALSTKGFNFRVEGHTDNLNIYSFLYPSNWELSCARAVTVVRYMTEIFGLDPKTISAAGYGRYRPIADNSTPIGRRKNRRIEIVIYEPTKPPDVTLDLNNKILFKNQEKSINTNLSPKNLNSKTNEINLINMKNKTEIIKTTSEIHIKTN